MSRNKSNTKWEYVTTPFDVYALATAIRRAHAPLDPSLSINSGGRAYLHLRPCVQGVDQDGAVIKYLYCTRDGRFFVRNGDGWGELKLNYTPNRPSAKDGRCHSTYPIMLHFGAKLCHQCVAYAWIGPRPKGRVCDHLDTNILNLRADNLQWVTVEENLRRGKIARKLRAIGIDPKRVYLRILKGIYRLPEDYIGTLTGMYLWLCHNEFGDQPLDIRTINATLAAALDEVNEKLS